MSTTAMISFRDGEEVYWIRRGHDGFPGVVLPDLGRLLEAKAEGWGRWSGAECGQLVSLFLAMFGDPKQYVYLVEYRGGGWHASLEP